MGLTINDIFPCESGSTRILEPHECVKFMSYPTLVGAADSGVVFRRKLGLPIVRYQYKYNNIMSWEYQLIENFFTRMNGPYEVFYLVDWSTPYHITNISSDGLQITLSSVSQLTSSAGYIGNTILVYSGNLDPQIQGVTDKSLHKITAINQLSVTVDQSVPSGLRTADSLVWILAPVIFEGDSLAPNYVAQCLDKEVIYFRGYGNRSKYGPIIDINLSFRALASLPPK